jgi:hypothetical protein
MVTLDDLKPKEKSILIDWYATIQQASCKLNFILLKTLKINF